MKLGASIFPRKIIPIEKSLDYFESNRYIEYMEIFHDYPNRDIDVEKDLIDKFNSYDLKYTVHAPFIEVNPASVNPALAKASVDEIKRSVDLANLLDSDIVVIHPGRAIFTNDMEYMASVYRIAEENLKVIGEYAKDNGVMTCIENLPRLRGFMYQDINQLNETLERTGLPMTLDIGHAYTAGFDVDDVSFDCISHIHIHDNDGIRDSHLPLGEGIIDFKRFFEIFDKYDGIYNFELGSKEYIEKSIDYLKGLKLI
ncbi:xylose isomerase-like TIM barrel domain-containing protein [Methanobrevibacter ruminantium M1]|uniref:Xylose isomerase-like TIM barrel domain-containing protein n=1 Tax=Methanobrevibacter ruminantium (strain ATCC 35063 / DSM 1093 / JCM 13430 / OCM 146 / M1) TaxID=634498 RepID=D3E3J0_METRM|nr:sugar phosphate isomerase/epimerase family protein [Methanobrevibacter ruminantium]ADC47101.1 xylose isomerase-like TIM barrel domain-containing protein [Methanobrevibacter ruminantium M1]